MSTGRWYTWLPGLVILLAVVLLGYSAWELRQARQEEGVLRARFESLLETSTAQPKSAEPIRPNELPEVYRKLIERALDLGLKVREVNPGVEDGMLTVEGGFAEAYAMLGAVRATDLPVWVKGIEIARIDEQGKRLSVTFTLGIKVAVPEEEGDTGQ